VENHTIQSFAYHPSIISRPPPDSRHQTCLNVTKIAYFINYPLKKIVIPFYIKHCNSII